MPILAAGVLGGASLLGGLFGSSAAESAASQQAGASEYAANIQQQEFNKIRQSLAPYMKTGTQADASLKRLLGIGQPGGVTNSFLAKNPMSIIGQPNFTAADFKTSPGYQFSLQQGENAINSAATPTAGTYSGNTLKALSTYGTGVANQEYQQDYTNWINNYWNKYNAITGRQNQTFNMLSTLAGAGQNAASSAGAYGTTAATNIGQDVIGAGNATAAGTLGSAQSLLSGLSGATGALSAPTAAYQNSLLGALLSGGSGVTGGITGTGDYQAGLGQTF